MRQPMTGLPAVIETRASSELTVFDEGLRPRGGTVLRADVVAPGASGRESAEQAIIDAGFPLPLSYREASARCGASNPSTLIVVRDETEVCLGGLALETRGVSFPPAHRVARVERLGASMAPEAVGCAVDALLRVVAADSRILRVNVELFARDPALRSAIAGRLSATGFERSIVPNCYTSTLVIDLAPDIDTVFGSLERSARRNIRATAKHPVIVRPIDDPGAEARMNDLVREALARTGGRAHTRKWAEIIRFSLTNPSLSRLVGFYRTDVTGPDSLVAFAWGRSHGDHVEYADSGSIRPTDLRVALSYALVWDLIVWAKASGAQWFDLGGVTPGTADANGDPLGGISDFKRFFSSQVEEVGEEWVLTPPTARARLARAAHAKIAALRDRRALAEPRAASPSGIPIPAYPQPSAAAIAARRQDVAELLRGFDSLHSSGAEALYEVFRSLRGNVSAGTKVWIPAYHCGVEVQAALDAGCEIGFYRVRPDLSVDTDDLARRLAERPGPVLLIHYFGFSQPDAEQVAALCATADMPLVDDCAHALLTPVQRRSGMPAATVFSLQKFLPVFDGGALRVHSDAVTRAVATRTHLRPWVVAAKRGLRAILGDAVIAAARGVRTRSSGRLTSDMPAPPAAHPSIPAVRTHGLGMSGLSRMMAGAESASMIRMRRRENYTVLAAELAGLTGYSPVFPTLPDHVVPLVLPIRVRHRNSVVQQLEAAGISPYVFGEHPHPDFQPSEFPGTSLLADEILGLPVQQQLDATDMRRIARIIKPILAGDAAAPHTDATRPAAIR